MPTIKQLIQSHPVRLPDVPVHRCLSVVGTVTASTLSTCEPVVTVVLAALVLGESMSFVQLLGGVLILLAAVTLVRRETGAKGGVRRAEEEKSLHR